MEQKILSLKTEKTYTGIIEKLVSNGLNFSDYDNVINYLYNTYENIGTIKTQLISIIWFLKSNFNNYNSELLEKYKNKLMEIKPIIEKKYNSQIDNSDFLTWDEVILTINKLQEIKNKTKNESIQYCCLALHVYIPTRRFNEISTLIYKNNIINCSEKKNYFINNNSQFVFNDFKTVKKIGKQIIDSPKELTNIIQEYVKYQNINDDEKMFKLSENYLRKLLSDLFLKYVNKNNITTNDIRHAFINQLYKNEIPTLTEIKNYALMMGQTSCTTNMLYIKKKSHTPIDYENLFLLNN